MMLLGRGAYFSNGRRSLNFLMSFFIGYLISSFYLFNFPFHVSHFWGIISSKSPTTNHGLPYPKLWSNVARHPWMQVGLSDGFSKWHDGILSRIDAETIPNDES